MKLIKNKPILILILLAILLRLPLLNGSFWLDESAQALESARPFSQQLDIVSDFQPPLLHYLLHFAMLVNHSEAWLRLWGALIPGLVTILVSYLIGKKLVNKTVGLITSLLLATSSFHVFFSQELRPYSLACMWAMFSWLFLIELWQKKATGSKQDKKTWLVYLMSSILGLFSSYTFPFVLLSQFLLTLALYRHQLKSHLIALVITSTFFLPWLPTFFKQLSAGTVLRTSMPGWETVVSLPQLQAVPLTLGKLVFGVIRLDTSWYFLSLVTIILLLSAVLLVFNLRDNNQDKNISSESKKKLLMIFLAGALPLLSSWLVSFWTPVVQPKRLLFMQPFIYLFVATLATQAWRTKQKLQKIFATFLLLIFIVINLFSLHQYYTQPHLQREDWRGLRQLVRARFPDNDTVLVFAFGEPFAPWRWYDHERFSTIATGRLNQQTYPQVQDKLKPIFEYQYVLVFDYLRDLTDPEDLITKAVEEFGYEQYELINLENIGFVRVYLKDKLIITG